MTEPPKPDYAKATISAHAASELRRRALPASELSRALQSPAETLQVRIGRVVLHHRYHVPGREYLLRVFVDIDVDPPVVVTVYRTSKIAKYWST